MEVEFKIATSNDVEGIVELCNLCFDENTNYKKAKRIFDSTANDPNQIYLIGIAAGRIIAHTKLAIVPTMFDGMDTFAILNHVCVHPDFRRGHIGLKMMSEVERIAKERGVSTLKLWSKNFRQPAHAMYRRFGFESIDATFFEKEVA